ncbi:SGT1-domain-containing protein [Amniculicola lignicola CBS 123094]|uniref:SGT1-domain-containing protein n=1 Tax=Amniculicola lignicola CBS 123094 TaxID=1392246 RepID=A0A6A5VYN0_9PLEO|nr:SGT1-domain-containing protein [Amniculicola lignicola CBS 123094]
MDTLPQDDNLKWFGEEGFAGFPGFPRRLPQDTAEYAVFIIDSRLSQVHTRERLQAFQRALAGLERRFLRDYIWQRGAVGLDLCREHGRWLLKGATNYGDSVADEWLIVFLLRELSSEFPDAWVRIYDTDGEFLLIEAAKALPRWVTPEVAENRVWINRHRLLVIAPSRSDEEPAPLGLEAALDTLTLTPAAAQHYARVEREAFHRLGRYPAAIAENQHHATLPLPRSVAHMLHAQPSYVAPAIEAFYLRDPAALKLLDPARSGAPLAFAPADFVQVSVRFTKALYAQLQGQRWTPPGPWAHALDELLQHKDHVPSVAAEKAELGLKLAAGMEMLVRHGIYADSKAARELQLLLEDLRSGDDALPTDHEVAAWPQVDDDASWLNIDLADLERELAGKGAPGLAGDGFGDKAAQATLRKMVERFASFIEDDSAGPDGAASADPMDRDNDSDTEKRGWEDPEDSDEESRENSAGSDSAGDDDDDDDAAADAEFAEYEKAFENFMTLSAAEKAILTDEARELARAEEEDKEEDQEIEKLSKMMEAELFSHGALNRSGDADVSKKSKMTKRPMTASAKGKAKATVGYPPDEGSDVEEILDEDYNLVDNMLKAFKSQGGMPGPAGNLMGLMGVQLPEDADDDARPGGSNV